MMPTIYIWLVRFHFRKLKIRQLKKKKHVFPDPIETDPLFGFFGIRSSVYTQAAPNSVALPVKGSDKTKKLSDIVQEKVPYLKDGSWELMSPALFNGHLQTLYASSSHEHLNKVYYGRRCIYWEDGSLVTADYHIPAPSSQAEWKEKLKYCPLVNAPPFPGRLRYFTPEEIEAIKNPEPSVADKPLLVLLHGLSGGSHESYIRSVVNMISGPKYNFDCVVLNSRGCARTPITTPQLFCAMWTEDIRQFIRLLRKEQPAGRRIYLVGFSLGASILANFLGQEGDLTRKPETRVDAAIVVANPWDLNHSSQYMTRSFLGRVAYSPSMAQNLLRLAKNHHKKLEGQPTFDYEKRHDVTNIAEFDDAFTAPMFGFDTAKDYYRNASSVHRLMNIRTPTLLLNALDDPVVHKDCIPYKEAYKNPYIILTTTTLGGHLGWTQPGQNNFWAPKAISKFFKVIDDTVDHEKGVPEVEVARPERLMVGDRLKVRSFKA